MSKTREAYEKFQCERVIYEQTYNTPAPPPFEKIDNHDLPKSEQYFKRTLFPYAFDEWGEEEQDEFIDNEWDKIDNGYWFFNNGKLIYITGVHYFYINWWKILLTEEGKPKRMDHPRFVDCDISFFYMWDLVANVDRFDLAKRRAGLIYVTNRRDGKSYKFGCIMYLRAIQYRNSNHGIQSKGKTDALGFLKKIVDSWKELPWIFRPPDSQQKNPTKSLDFSEPSGRVKNSDKLKRKKGGNNGGEYLNSHIIPESTIETAFDGENLMTYVNDETGKNTESDVHRTLNIVLETMVAGTYITGKCGVTSTVEEMEKGGGKNLFKIWQEADPNKNIDHLGRTQNKLIRYFKPAYYGLEGEDENGVPFINKYGETDWRRAKAHLEKEREFRTGETLKQRIRMYPFTIEEAFQQAHDCYFDAAKLNQHLDYNNIYVNESNLYQGNFHWKTSSEGGEVWWQPDPEGKFFVSWFPDLKDRNQWIWVNTEEGKHRSPARSEVRGGADPFDHLKTADNRNSDGSFHLFRGTGVWDGGKSKDPLTKTFVVEYIHRPPTPEEFYEDVIKACVFYSSLCLIESNKSGLINEFRRTGYYDFVMKRPSSTHTKFSAKAKVERGIALSGDIPRRVLPNKLMSYIFNDMGKNDEGALKCFMPFNRTLEDWLKFNPAKWTEYDATVSSMLAIVAAMEDVKLKEEDQPIIDLLQEWDNSGEVGQYKQ